MRLRSFPLVLLAPLIAACGGGNKVTLDDPVCPAIVGYPANPAYAGVYDGFYSESGAAFIRLTFHLSVAADGTATGTVDDTETGETGLAVGGTATDFVSGCDATKAAAVLTFTSEGASQMLGVFKKRDGVLPGTFEGARTPDPHGGGSGFLVLSKAS